MPIKADPPDTDDCVRRYLAGESVPQIAEALGVTSGRRRHIYAALHAAGVIKRKGPTRNPVDSIEAAGLYASGESILALSKRYSVSRTAISRLLVAAGVKLRSASEQERIKWGRMRDDPAAVERQCGAAWDAVRGAAHTDDHRRRIAVGNQASMGHSSPVELVVGDCLRAVGIEAVPQFAADRYNLDLAIPERRIAVEIQWGGISFNTAESFRERCDYLSGKGWCVLYAVHVGLGIDTAYIREKVVALCDLASRDEWAVRGCYGMIRGDGKDVTPRSRHLDHLPRVPGF